MARTELERSVQPSLIDRLTDLELDRPSDGPISRDESERAFRRSVQRDVEWLLNTRRGMVLAGAGHPETHASTLEYGLRDTSGITVGGVEGQQQLVEFVRDSLRRFEPRLANVSVSLREVDEKTPLQVRFVIHATLRMDPTPEQIVFDTVLEVSSGTYEVEDDG
jgi:type VI secretion system protein ImpF